MTLWTKGSLINRWNISFLQSLLERNMATGGSALNRLAKEKSPYLLQHASNPVDWYPWGEEAFEAAKKQNKLIFLSVGYSTCHWCHVMERESFEDAKIAKIMNEHFINIKVDREERPDVDKVYMTFVTATSGQGGWPMSVFLTPKLEPVAGGTYFPPTDRYGRPGFTTVLTSLGEKWKSEETKFKTSGSKIMDVLKRNSRLPSRHESDLPTEEVFARGFAQFSSMYEPEYGGFGDAPKFPQPSNFNFLFAYKALCPHLDDSQSGLEMCLYTLKMMERGGIHDHVSQGFARYSTDRKWHVPHFEKMLYDQAQLVMSYLDAFLFTKDHAYARVVDDIMTYVCRDLSHPLGGFYSAEDADSLPTLASTAKREGAFCVWSHNEVCEVLSEPIEDSSDLKLHDVFNFHFSVMDGGNLDPYQDPHEEMKNQNVLITHGTVSETASELGLSEGITEACLKRSLKLLFEARQKRPRPHLDDKMVTAWNGMMLSAAARAGAVLNNQTYIDRAVKSAEFILRYLLKDGKLYRAAYKEGENVTLGSEISGFSDDYAWVVRGFVQVYESTMDEKWLQLAEQLQEKQNELFWDSSGAGYFMGPQEDTSILLKLKDDHDGAEPSVNSVSCINLIRLSRLLNRQDFEHKGAAILKLFSDRLTKVPASLPEMATGLLLYSNPAEQIIISGDKDSSSFKPMLNAVHSSSCNPNRIILYAGMQRDSLLYSRNENLEKFVPKLSEDVVAFVCKDFTCSLPLKSASLLKEKISNG